VFVPLDEHSTPGCRASAFMFKGICQFSVRGNSTRRNPNMRWCIATSNGPPHCGAQNSAEGAEMPQMQGRAQAGADLGEDDVENNRAQHHGRGVAQRTVAR
jgi:hypothetical protein